jgi:outer membrane immunogenic protein
MKKIIIASVAVGVFSGAPVITALAADMPSRPSAPTAYDWTGLYFGGHVGGGWQTADFNDPSSFPILVNFPGGGLSFASGPGQQAILNSGFLGGLQAGWNYQIQRLVLGTEVDFSFTHLHGTNSAPLPLKLVPPDNDTETAGITTNWIGSATTRLGIARDTWLLYGKAGAAWANNSYSLTHAGFIPGLGPFGFAANMSETRIGWTVGTGLEWAFARNWTAKVEYDYMDFGTASENFAGNFSGAIAPPLFTNIAVNVKDTISEVKVGVNYKFDPGFLFW